MTCVICVICVARVTCTCVACVICADSYFLSVGEADLKDTVLWRMWCKEHDPEFYAQASVLKFWRSFDRKGQWPSAEQILSVSGLETVLKPKLSHTSYAEHFHAYDLRRGSPRVDTCDKCDCYNDKIAAETDEAEERRLQEEHHKHKVAADKAYKMQKADMARTEEDFPDGCWDNVVAGRVEFCSVKGCETQVQDAGGNLRTPRLTVGEAYYKRILQTFNYDIYSHAKRRHGYFFWNEVSNPLALTLTPAMVTSLPSY